MTPVVRRGGQKDPRPGAEGTGSPSDAERGGAVSLGGAESEPEKAS